MSRSVSTPSGAVAIAYKDASYIEHEFDWDFFKENIVCQLQTAFPSLNDADGWIGREDHIVLDNGHCQITISEYCGLVAVSLVPLEAEYDSEAGLDNLHLHWCGQISNKFTSLLGEFNKIGTFSNGEAVFEAIAQ